MLALLYIHFGSHYFIHLKDILASNIVILLITNYILRYLQVNANEQFTIF